MSKTYITETTEASLKELEKSIIALQENFDMCSSQRDLAYRFISDITKEMFADNLTKETYREKLDKFLCEFKTISKTK